MAALASAGDSPNDLLRGGEARRIRRAFDVRDIDDLPTYDLALSIDDTTASYSGRAHITWTNDTSEPLAEFPFYLHPNAIEHDDRGTLTIADFSVLQGPHAEFSEHAGDGQVAFERPIEPGEEVAVSFVFDGTLRTLDDGVNGLMGQVGAMASGGDYGLLAAGNGLLTVASSYPTLAPFGPEGAAQGVASTVGDLAWNRVATYRVDITAPAGLQVVTNLRDRRVDRSADGSEHTHAAGTGVRDFVMVASRDFVVHEQAVGPVTVRSWSLAGDQDAGEQVLAETVEALVFLQDHYGRYPFKELDVVQASLVGGAGGVEFSSLVLIAGFLYREPELGGLAAGLPGLEGFDAIGTYLSDTRRFVVAHEIAHQWSPGLVGGDSRNHPVVDEPLAQYLASRVIGGTDGADAGRASLDRNAKVNYGILRMMGLPDGAVDRPTSEFDSGISYAALVYGKAPYLYAHLEDAVGVDVLDDALHDAFAAHAYQVVHPDVWVETLQEQGADGAVDAAERYWRQSHGDEDLGVDDSGKVVIETILGPELADEVLSMFETLGIDPARIMQGMLEGGGMPGQPPPFDPEDLLREMLSE